jgi:hemolysin III
MILWRLTRGDSLRRFGVTVFGASMVLLYAASGLFHGLRLPADELRTFQQIDQSAIFVLIAGTNTPIMLVLLPARWGRPLLGAVWLLAFLGIASLWLLPKAPHVVTVGMYLGMGWLGMCGSWHYYLATGRRGISWALGGAAFYTAGAVCELAHWPNFWPGVVGPHEILHLCDMAGTFCHFVFIARFVVPYRAPVVVPAEPALRAA